MSSKRIQLIDAVRGFCVILMVGYHFAFDLVDMLHVSGRLFNSPAVGTFRYLFAGTFILISGVSSRFSHSNVKRGLKVIAAAAAITAATYFFNYTVLFGILHFLGFCMVFYGLTSRFWDKMTGGFVPVLYCVLFVLSYLALNRLNPVNASWLWPLGLWNRGFYSSDYYPIFPWIFVFLWGTWLGKYIKDGKFPDWFYTANPPVLPQIGRKSFIIYLVHQPVLLVIVEILKRFTRT